GRWRRCWTARSVPGAGRPGGMLAPFRCCLMEGVVVVSDLAVAGLILAMLVGLAIMAPIWGVYSRDGMRSGYTYWPERALAGESAGRRERRPDAPGVRAPG